MACALSSDQADHVSALARDTGMFLGRHFTLTVPSYTQAYELQQI